MFKAFKALLAGLVAGTVVGVLFAPKKGKELRKEFKKEIDGGGFGIDTFKGAATDMGKDIGETSQKVYADVSKNETYKKKAKKTYLKAKALVGKVAEKVAEKIKHEE